MGVRVKRLQAGLGHQRKTEPGAGKRDAATLSEAGVAR